MNQPIFVVPADRQHRDDLVSSVVETDVVSDADLGTTVGQMEDVMIFEFKRNSVGHKDGPQSTARRSTMVGRKTTFDGVEILLVHRGHGVRE
jgi:hypothetical protein